VYHAVVQDLDVGVVAAKECKPDMVVVEIDRRATERTRCTWIKERHGVHFFPKSGILPDVTSFSHPSKSGQATPQVPKSATYWYFLLALALSFLAMPVR
jgi:hypothetical protein